MTLLWFGLTLCCANLVIAGRGSGNRVATVSFGKRFDRAEVVAMVDPALSPLGYARLPDSAASMPGVTYETGVVSGREAQGPPYFQTAPFSA